MIRSRQYFCTTARSLQRISQPEKRFRDERSECFLRYLLFELKNVQALAPPMLVNIELRRQRQPHTCRPVKASNGAPRSAKHERREVTIRVTGCRMTKIQEWLHGRQTQLLVGVRFGDLVVL